MRNLKISMVNALLMSISLLLVGCSNLVGPPASSTNPILIQSGKIIVTSQQQTTRFKFHYKELHNADYEITLYPLFCKPIILQYTSNKFVLDLFGGHYEDEQALVELNKLAPYFPWHELALLIRKGQLDTANWTLEHWSSNEFHLAGQDCTLHWKAITVGPLS